MQGTKFLYVFFVIFAVFSSVSAFSCKRSTDKSKSSRRYPKSIAKLKEMYEDGKYQELMDILVLNKKKLSSSYEFWNIYGLTLRINSYMDKDAELRDEEISAFKKVVELNPDFGEGHFNLAVSLWETDKKQSACDEFKKALALMPEHPDKTEIEKRIAKCENKTSIKSNKKQKSKKTSVNINKKEIRNIEKTSVKPENKSSNKVGTSMNFSEHPNKNSDSIDKHKTDMRPKSVKSNENKSSDPKKQINKQVMKGM
jgi:tetratricopeptide (TPR) repeat protein